MYTVRTVWSEIQIKCQDIHCIMIKQPENTLPKKAKTQQDEERKEQVRNSGMSRKLYKISIDFLPVWPKSWDE